MFSRQYICIIIFLTLTACGDGGESTPQQAPSTVVPLPTPIPAIATIDLTGQTGAALAVAIEVNGEQTKNRSAVNDSFANAIGTLRHVNSNTNVEGNLTIGVTASDNDYMTKVSLYLPNVGREFVLCSDSCVPNFQSTITGFNPQLANEISGPLRIELIVQDSLGNSAIVDALSVNWQPIQISAISGSRDNGVVTISWSGNSSLERYNVYAATELGLTTLNAQTLDNGTQQLAINGTSTTFSDADASKDYHLLITGIDSGGESGESNPYIIPRTTGTPNQSPIANNDNYQVNEDETVTVNVLDNDFDPDGQLITIESLLLQPANGSLDFDTAGNFTYSPNVNYNGTDSASYRLIDSEGATAEATVLFNILAINDNPTAVNDTYGVEFNGQISAANTNLLSNDSDIDGDDLQISTTPITAPQKGTVTINADGSFFYQSTGVLSDNDQFVYQILDGFGGTASATVTILPNGETLPPVARNDEYQIDEDNTLVIASVNLGILANDSDPNDLPFQLLETLLIQPQNGQLNLSLDGTFTYIPNINFVGIDQFQYQIKNSADILAEAFVTITINSVADIPIALDDNYQAQEDVELLVAASSGLLINDVDFDNSILKVNIIPVNPPQKGDLALAQDGSFSYIPNADFNGIDSFTYQVINEQGLTNTANVNIVTAPINDAPTVINDSVTINEDNRIVVDVLANDSDKEGDEISLISFDIDNGSAAIINNKLDITPSLNFYGQLNITYTVSDSTNATSSGQLVVTVLPINDAPLTQDDSYSLVEDTVLNILATSPSSLLINDSDVDGDTLTVNTTPVSNVSNGSLTLNSDGSFRYIPNSNFNGSDRFSYQVRDGKGGTAQGSVMLSINGINDIPVAINDIYSLDEDATLSILANDANQLLSNDSDVDGDSLTVNTTPVANVSNGSITLNSNGSFSYTPSLNFNGTDSFTYQVSDSNGGIAQASVSLTIRAVNDLPVIGNAKQYSVDEDTNLNILATDSNHLLNDASDLDGDTLTVSLASNVNNGSLTLNSNGSFSYAPNLNFTGTDSFTYTVSDGNFVSGALNVTLTVNPINDIPVIGNAKSYNVDEDESLNILATSNNHLLNDASDLDGDILTVSLVSNVGNGNLALNNNGSFSYAPNLNFNGSDTFSYKVSDGDYVSDALTATLTVNPINDAPQLTGAKSYGLDEDSSLNILVNDVNHLLIGASDLDGDSLTINTTPIMNVSNGTLTLNSNGSFGYVPNNNYHGSDNFTYEVSDGNGGIAQSNVTLTINAVSDLPVAIADSYSVDEEGSLTILIGDTNNLLSNDSDGDNDSLTVDTTPISNVTSGSLTLNNDGSFNYQPIIDFSGIDSFIYEISDGNGGTAQATVTLTVNGINDFPVAQNDSYSFAEDFTWVRFVTDGDQLLSNDSDVDGDTLTVNTTPLIDVGNGILTLAADGSFSYTPNEDYTGADSFTYEISDGNGGTAQASVALIVNPINDSPVAVDDSYTFDEDTTLTKLVGDSDNLLDNDDDVDGDSLTVTLVSGVSSNGSLTLNANGSFSYTPEPNFNGTDSFTYRIDDSHGGIAQANVNLTISAANDAPIVEDQSFSVDEDKTEGDVVGSVIASDIENNTLDYSLTAGDTHLFNIDSSSGAITVKGTTPLDFETNDQHIVTVTITDDGSPTIAFTDITVTININDVAGDELISEVASFGRPIIGSLELTGIKNHAQLIDSVRKGNNVYFVGSIDNVDKDIYMVVYTKDGVLDTSFGNTGIKTFDFGQHEYAKAITHNGGDYYVAFNQENGTHTEVCFIKLDNNGEVDSDFGYDGVSCTSEEKTLSINNIVYNSGNDTLAAVGKVAGIDGVSDDDFLMIEMDTNGVFIDHTPADTTDSPHIIEDISLSGLDDEGISIYNPNNTEVVVTGNVLTDNGDSDIFAAIYDNGDINGTFNGGNVKFYDVSGQGLDDKVKGIDGISGTDYITHMVGSTTLLSGAKDAFIMTIFKTSAVVTTFGPNGNGINTYDVDGDAGIGVGSSEFTGIVAADDNLYLGGSLFDGQSKPFTSRILAVDGLVDIANYGVDGYQKVSYASDNAFALSVTLGNENNLWLPGYVESGGDKSMVVSVVESNGDLFNDNDIINGKKTLIHSSLASDDSVSQMLQVKNGAQQDKFLVLSTADDATDKHIILTRLTRDGLLDTTFDYDGHKQLKIGTSATAKGIFELSTGKFIVYGNVTEAGIDNGFVARIDQNGLLDRNFASNGIYTTSAFGATNIDFEQVSLDSLGRLIAVGRYQNGSTSAFVLRLTALGGLDTTFNALDTLGYIIGADTDDYSTVVTDGSNNIYAGGSRASGDKDMLLVKYLASGLLDNAFNSNTGALTVDFFGNDESVEYLAFDSHNSLYVVGNGLSTRNFISIVKTSINGALDNSFSSDGKASYKMAPLLDITGEAGMTSAVIDSDDNIVVVGFNDVFLGNGKRHMIGRIKPDGTLDNTFDADGYFRDSACPNESQLESITLLNNSSFIVAGQCYQNGIFKNNTQISHYLLD